MYEDDDIFGDIDIDEYGGIRSKEEYETIVKKCYCGFKGELVPDVGGFCCQSCGYLLVET